MTTAPARFTVNGMTCGGCAKKVRTAIEKEIGEGTEATVDHSSGLVTVASPAPFTPQSVQAVVERLGYEFAGTTP